MIYTNAKPRPTDAGRSASRITQLLLPGILQDSSPQLATGSRRENDLYRIRKIKRDPNKLHQFSCFGAVEIRILSTISLFLSASAHWVTKT